MAEEKSEVVEMDLSALTVEALAAQRPDMVEAICKKQIETDAKASAEAVSAAVKSERDRAVALAKIGVDMSMGKVLIEVLEKGVSVVEGDRDLKAAKLLEIKGSAPASPGASDEPPLQEKKAAKTFAEMTVDERTAAAEKLAGEKNISRAAAMDLLSKGVSETAPAVSGNFAEMSAEERVAAAEKLAAAKGISKNEAMDELAAPKK